MLYILEDQFVTLSNHLTWVRASLSAYGPVLIWYPKTYIYNDSLNKDNWFYLTGAITSHEYFISQSAIQGLHDHTDYNLYLACQRLGSKPSPKPTLISIRNKDNSFWIIVSNIGGILFGFHLTNIFVLNWCREVKLRFYNLYFPRQLSYISNWSLYKTFQSNF